MTHPSDPGNHPHPSLLERFMRNEAGAPERRWIVRHLIAGCERCLAVTRSLWALAEPPAGAGDGGDGGDSGDGEQFAAPRARESSRRRPHPGGVAHGEGTAALFEQLTDAARRIEEEREQAPRLAAELLAGPPPVAVTLAIAELPASPAAPSIPGSPPIPGTSAIPGISTTPGTPETPVTPAIPAINVALLAGPAYLTPAVCEVLLDRSRAAAADPGLALRAADLALAIAERLDPGRCGATVAKGLRVRAWAHVAQARRLGDDLDGAEWALALAESRAREMAGDPGFPDSPESPATFGRPGRPGPGVIETAAGSLPLVPAEWAELLVFKAGLFADRGDLVGAERLLGRAAELFEASAESQRAGRTLVQQGLIRADLGDPERAAELLRAGVELLDPVAEPGLVAANLNRLAALLRGIALAAGETGGHALSAQRALKEALRLVQRARTLYRSLGDAAAEAHLTRLQGQIEAALGNLEAAEATLLAATTALAEHGRGREATLAQIELALVLFRQGRAAEVRRLGLERWPLLQARDKSWEWVAAVLVFQVLAAGIVREPPHPATAKMLGELARYLAPQTTMQPDDPRRRLERVA